MKELQYFSHDLNARNDSKLQKLQMKYGMEGLGIYWCLVEMLYENKNSLPISREGLDCIVFELRLKNFNSLKNIILDFGLFENDEETFWSKSIGDRVDIMRSKSSAGRKAAYNKWGEIKSSQKNRSERLAAARKIGTHKKDEWEKMKLFFKNICVKCNGATELNGVVKDHIVPLYQGGSDGIENLQPLCARCNSQKGPESTDYRIEWCLQNACEMPAEWLQNACYKEKEKKEKEKKENKKKEKEVELFANAQSSPLVADPKKIFAENSKEIYFSKLLQGLIRERDPKAKIPNWQNWASDIDKLCRIDNRSWEEIELVIRWSQQDDFWQSNILSAKKLRSKFPQLILKAKNSQQYKTYKFLTTETVNPFKEAGV